MDRKRVWIATVVAVAVLLCGAAAWASPTKEQAAAGAQPAAAAKATTGKYSWPQNWYDAPIAKMTKLKEAPMLAELVKAGKLPPVEQRVPREPLLVAPYEKVGVYGGTLRVARMGPADWGDMHRGKTSSRSRRSSTKAAGTRTSSTSRSSPPRPTSRRACSSRSTTTRAARRSATRPSGRAGSRTSGGTRAGRKGAEPAKGEEPPADEKSFIDLYAAYINAVDPVEYAKLAKEFWAMATKRLELIGTVGKVPRPIIISNRIQNVPERLPFAFETMLWVPPTPWQWYVKE